jgi:hypothetical protein
MKLQPAAQHPAPLVANSAVGAPSSPSAAASAILKAALSLAQHRAPKTDLSVPFAPLKVRLYPTSSSASKHESNLSVTKIIFPLLTLLYRRSMPLASTLTRSPSLSPTPQSATPLTSSQHQLLFCTQRAIFCRFDSRLKADSADVAAAAASASEHKKPGGYRIKRGDIEKALNRAVAFENQMEQMIVDEKADAEKQQQLQPKSAATSDKLALVQQEKNAQVAAISSALEQVRTKRQFSPASLDTVAGKAQGRQLCAET